MQYLTMPASTWTYDAILWLCLGDFCVRMQKVSRKSNSLSRYLYLKIRTVVVAQPCHSHQKIVKRPETVKQKNLPTNAKLVLIWAKNPIKKCKEKYRMRF